jgi:hypothetical protein
MNEVFDAVPERRAYGAALRSPRPKEAHALEKDFEKLLV